jgi:hypothetical protein
MSKLIIILLILTVPIWLSYQLFVKDNLKIFNNDFVIMIILFIVLLWVENRSLNETIINQKTNNYEKDDDSLGNVD